MYPQSHVPLIDQTKLAGILISLLPIVLLLLRRSVLRLTRDLSEVSMAGQYIIDHKVK